MSFDFVFLLANKADESNIAVMHPVKIQKPLTIRKEVPHMFGAHIM
jgi:hypothetical protein